MCCHCQQRLCGRRLQPLKSPNPEVFGLHWNPNGVDNRRLVRRRYHTITTAYSVRKGKDHPEVTGGIKLGSNAIDVGT